MSILSAFVANLPRPPPASNRESINVFKVLRSMTAMQWLFFASGWIAWTVDAIDFFSVSLSNHRLSEYFDKPLKTITTSITLTLLFRPVGAIIFGLLSDRYGRKWPLIADLLVCGVLSLGTAFVKTFSQFLAVRSLFGIAMGGIWGLSASLALENMPVAARGLFSGLLQQGYAVGYLIAAVLNLTEVAKHDDWRILFYFAAAVSAAAALFRLVLPESAYFVERREAEKASGATVSSGQKSKIFLREAGRALRLHWVRCIFAVVLMTCFNFFSHGSQDIYPSYMQDSKNLSSHQSTLATIVGNCGAIAGGSIAGYVSQFLGRRLTMIVMCIWTCAFIPLWLLPNSFGGLAAGAFFVQFGVQGAWGVVPVYLAELSPVAFRAVWPGVAYQLGNMVSSASAQIEATAGSNIRQANGDPDYGRVGAILICVIAGAIIICCLVGAEQHGSHFEKGKAAFEDGGGRDEIEELKDDAISPRAHGSDLEKDGAEKLGQSLHRESASTTTDDKRSVSTYA
ncbi:carboxylic acid transporter [Rhodotorula diobovata]|uniref:Carboxylic acid transporter n=1 Tax=Rhodotorula diobovata TaxID=5288 RepID=A0A5C5FNY8_9BASI|nr:carboxylic acid transporter [Rhodotorula diobovata]